MTATYNPYLKRTLPVPNNQHLLQNSAVTNESQEPSTATMGIQSNRRGSGIRNMKCKAVKVKQKSLNFKKWVQTAVDKGEAFVPHLHCRRCAAKEKAKISVLTGVAFTIPHRPHHPRRPTRGGKSERTVEIKKYCDKMIELNNRPLRKGRTKNLPSVLTHFSLNKSGNIKVTATTTINVLKASVEKEQLDYQQASPDEFYECVEIQTEDSFKDTTATPIATELRELLDTMMARPELRLGSGVVDSI
jgi:hypothetical protein